MALRGHKFEINAPKNVNLELQPVGVARCEERGEVTRYVRRHLGDQKGIVIAAREVGRERQPSEQVRCLGFPLRIDMDRPGPLLAADLAPAMG